MNGCAAGIPICCRWPAIYWCIAIEEWCSLPRWNPKLGEALLTDTRRLGEMPGSMALPAPHRLQGDGVSDRAALAQAREAEDSVPWAQVKDDLGSL